MIPQADYNDFSKFINDQHHERKSTLLQRTVRNSAAPSDTEQLQKTLGTKVNNFFGQSKGRTMSVDGKKTASELTKSFTSTTVKPKLLESKISTSDKFATLSDGFKRVFADDKKDQRLVIPICGYGGHRRGDHSQNFFGKSFRETMIQSKCLERELRPTKQAWWTKNKCGNQRWEILIRTESKSLAFLKKVFSKLNYYMTAAIVLFI